MTDNNEALVVRIADSVNHFLEHRDAVSRDELLKPIREALSIRPEGEAVAPVDIVGALRRAFSLGQTYWQQADSESSRQNAKADVTKAKFEQLVVDAQFAFSAPPAAAEGAPEDREFVMDGEHALFGNAAIRHLREELTRLRSQAGAVPVGADLQCWSCDKPVSFEERGEADGDCPHCGVELDLETYIDGLNDDIRRLKGLLPDESQEAVAVVDDSDDGLFVEILNGKNGCPVKFGDKLYLHPAAPIVDANKGGVPEGWSVKAIRVRSNGQPDVTNDMKAVCIGEFSFKQEVGCDHPNAEYPEECEFCGGEGTYEQEVTVPWTTCKDIFKAMVLAAPAAPVAADEKAFPESATESQRTWVAQYQKQTGFDALTDDWLAGTQSFEDMAHRSLGWLEDHFNDAHQNLTKELSGIADIPFDGSVVLKRTPKGDAALTARKADGKRPPAVHVEIVTPYASGDGRIAAALQVGPLEDEHGPLAGDFMADGKGGEA